MKKFYVVVLATVLFSTGALAQKGSNSIGFGGDLSLPTSDFGHVFNTGIGVYAKSMFGVGKSPGQVTFTSGYISFREKGVWEDYTTTVSIIPLLIGYRHNFSGFFVEPQLGYGVYGTKYSGEEVNYAVSEGAITWAANIGYIFNQKIEISARFQNGSKQGNTAGMFGLRAGYNFALKPKK